MKKSTVCVPLFIALVSIIFFNYGRPLWYPYYLKLTGRQTVSEAIDRYAETAEKRLTPFFENAGVSYPPDKISLIAFKDSRKLELWAHSENTSTLIKTYTIKAASGKAGPKLREGDRQVPEGIYRISALNPNSSYHLSMKLNYPNAFDLKHAKFEGRNNPGTNIFIHGKAASIGCLAMGDSAIEELFTIVQKVTKKNVKVIITPTDPDSGDLDSQNNPRPWVQELYENIEKAIKEVRGT